MARSMASRDDRRAERMLGALSCLVLALVVGMVVFVMTKAWPSFAHNGLSFFGSGGNVDRELGAIFDSPAKPENYVYELHAWALLWGTALTTLFAVCAGIVIATLSSIFIVEFAP